MEQTLDAHSEFKRLMAKVQAGDAEAARELYEKFGTHLMRVVRRRLQPHLRSKFDSIDFTQDVWGSFFTRVAAKSDFQNSADLARILGIMARNKIIAVTRGNSRRGQNPGRREASLVETHGGADRVPAVQQTPSQIVMRKEAWDQILAAQPPVYRRILLLLQEGKSPERITTEMGVSLRTVQRAIQRVSP